MKSAITFLCPMLIGLGLLIAAGVSFIAIAACAPAASYPDSPQFHNGGFRNPVQLQKQSAWRMARHRLRRGEVAVTFVNHATVLIQLPGLNIVIDPVWSKVVGPWSWAGPTRARQPGVPFDALPRIDVVLISHNHYDHLDLPTLRRLHERDRPRIFVPLGDQQFLEAEGIGGVTELDWWQQDQLDSETEIFFTPAQHNLGRTPWTNNRSLWGSFVLRRASTSIYFAGDAAYEAHFRAPRERFGPVDLAFLPIGAYAPREMMRRYHLNPEEAVQAQKDLEASIAVGVHVGTFQLTAEDFYAPIADLYQALETTTERPGPFWVLEEGRTRMFSIAAERTLTRSQ